MCAIHNLPPLCPEFFIPIEDSFLSLSPPQTLIPVMKRTNFLSIGLWLLLVLSSISADAGSTTIFDGRTFSGWDGETNHIWRIQDGYVTGGILKTGVKENQFLATQRNYTNFVLKLKFRLVGTNGFVNSGVQIRSQRVPNNTEMAGYQCDLGDPSWWGCVYDESRRNKVMAQSDMKAINAVLKRGEWNDYLIRAEGRRIRTYLNGALGADYTEQDTTLPQWGKLGLQIHGGGKSEASFKDIQIEELP